MPTQDAILGNISGQPKPNRRAFLYDFALHGGAIGDITLAGDTIPSGAQVFGAHIITKTALTSGGAATVALKVEAANDIIAATAYNAAPFTGTPVAAAEKTIKTTAARSVVATIAAQTVTAGKFWVVVEFWV